MYIKIKSLYHKLSFVVTPNNNICIDNIVVSTESSDVEIDNGIVYGVLIKYGRNKKHVLVGIDHTVFDFVALTWINTSHILKYLL